MYYACCFLALLASANAAITVLFPTAGSIWYRNDTVALNWTLSDPSTDTYLFRALLSNSDSSLLPSTQQIADSTNASATYVRIALPRLNAGQGYKVSLVNTTNESQVFAESESFEIQDGAVRNQTSSSASTSSTSTRSNGGLPGALSQAAFPSASSAQSSGAASPASFMPSLGGVGTAVALMGAFGGALAVLV